eukprot:TRINITY_DN681_c0_g1_i2.p1 TRINITY_DN681_c0_g1~~TRINITY_DN681_c0_g1_i2.p1  ORF type:complete len:498 (+),score=73.24 TRINITY_DN681_c0_g1_i2:86-1495(+)
MDPARLECLRMAFTASDRDGSGAIDKDELSLVLQLSGIQVQSNDVDAMFIESDVNGDGQITWDEFLSYTEKNHLNALSCIVDKLTSVRLAFELFDRDKSGGIDQNELQHVLKMVGVNIPQESVQAMFEADSDGDGQITFPEFVKYLENHSDSTLSNVVEDIVALQKAFLESHGCSNVVRISEMVLKLRGAVGQLTEEQVRVLVKLHSYTHKSDMKLKQIRGGSILTRKVISSNDVIAFLSEQWGDPSLGGFFARKASTEGMTANEIIAQLGLDYDGSPYVIGNQPCGLVYLIEADVNIDEGALVPLDPRLREKVRLLALKEGDDLQADAKKLYNHSYACAVADGSEVAKSSPIALPSPYVGAGFCVHGSKLDGGHVEAKLVQELVAMKKQDEEAKLVKVQRISYSIGTGIWAQGGAGELWLVAAWNGKDWIPSYTKKEDIPSWLCTLEKSTNEELYEKWSKAISAGHSR